MALNEKNVRAIEQDPEVQARLRELWDRDAPLSEFYDVLTAAGLEVTMGDLEETHAELQRRRGEEIAVLEKVDPEQLKKVAGGDGHGTGGCTEYYYKEQCTATVEVESHCWSNDWCMFFSSTYTPIQSTDPPLG